MKKENNVIGVVVLYNPKENVINNIKSYNTYCSKLIIVDNSEEINQSIHNELSQLENVEIIILNDNKGIAYALNIGIKKAIKYNYKWLMTMDQDSRFNENLIEKYFETTTSCDLNYVAVIAPNFKFDRKKFFEYDGYKEKKYVMQSGCLINIDICKVIGEFKEEFFIDGVDYEYCLRARKNSYKVLECGNAVLEHNPAETRKFLFFKYGYCSPSRIYYQIRNLLWINKNYKLLKMKIIILYKLFKIIFLFDNKKGYLKMYKRGKKDFYNNKFGKLEEIE